MRDVCSHNDHMSRDDDAEKLHATGAPSLLGLFDPPPSVSSPTGRGFSIEEKKSLDDGLTGEMDDEAPGGCHAYSDDDASGDTNAPDGSLSHMMGLFARPSTTARAAAQISSAATNLPSSPTRPPLGRPPTMTDRQSTEPRSNVSKAVFSSAAAAHSECTPLLEASFAASGATAAGSHPPHHTLDATPLQLLWRDSLLASPPTTPLKENRGSAYSINASTATSSATHHLRLPSTSPVRMPWAAMPAIFESLPQKDLPVDRPPPDRGGIEGDQTAPQRLLALAARCGRSTVQSLRLHTTYIGSFMYLLYHVVFCLALGSAITRPHSPTDTSILGLMTKTAALGTVAASPVYWFSLSGEVPALYPTADLFLAPFLANLALIVDQTLSDGMSLSTDDAAGTGTGIVVTKENYDAVFLVTFGVLTAIGFLLSSCLLVAASLFKLANLGSFLPFSVICGFFAAVGILMWTLAVNVDTGGKSVGMILTSGDWELWRYALTHHVPTLAVAGLMKYLGPKNPFFVVAVVFATVALFHVVMFVTGTSMEEMTETGWFWSHDQLVYDSHIPTMGFAKWAPPAPFGVLAELRQVHWGAVQKGLSTAVALSFLYLIRCSVHGAALKKNIPNLARKVRSDDPALKRFGISDEGSLSPKHKASPTKGRSRTFSEAVDIEAVMKPIIGNTESGNGEAGDKQKYEMLLAKPSNVSRKFSEAVDIEVVMQPIIGNTESGNGEADDKPKYEMLLAKPSNVSLKSISLTYGWSQLVSALVGGFAVTPAGMSISWSVRQMYNLIDLISLHISFGISILSHSIAVAASTTLFSLGADGLGPQIGSVLLLLVFYLTDFQIVAYIPKPAFSSMLVLSSIDMIWSWFYKSYFRTKDKLEWMVVPSIVVVAFALDLLSAVFIGIAFSTFIFVAAFFRSGVVKYVATGQTIHSTIERSFRMSDWLNENGGLISIMVLQNYLFFGNASSVYSYICSMFTGTENLASFERKPRILILDLTLVTGMDTSTADIFQDIRNLCNSNKCKLLMSGMSPDIRSILGLGGFKADSGVRSKRKLRFFQNLDAALGKAEDMLLDSDYNEREHQPSFLDGRRRFRDRANTGFRTALGYIDAEHGENFSSELAALQDFTRLVELNTGERLYVDGQSQNLERGLFFIECGILKVEHDTRVTATRGTMGSMGTYKGNYESSMATDTLKRIQERCLVNSMASEAQTFRLARIGVGWVAGTLEAVSGMEVQGEQVAVDYCRLHHLPFSKMQMVEKENPTLALTLYKLLSYLMARRQEATIGQLATLHSIMTSPPRWHSVGRSRSNVN